MKSQTIRKYPGYFICLIISISYDSRRSYSSIVWRSAPVAASCCSRGSRSLKPLARDVLEVVVEREAGAARRSWAGSSRPPPSVTLQRSAMRTVFASASGKSLNASAISSAVFRKNCLAS